MSLFKALIVDGYSWLQALHVISVSCWFAVLLILPRLLAHRAMTDDQSLEGIERTLYYVIGTPAAIAGLMSGGLLFVGFPVYFLGSAWFVAKLVLAALLFAHHLLCYFLLCGFQTIKNTRSPAFYRWFNVAPIALFSGIAIMVLVKPF